MERLELSKQKLLGPKSSAFIHDLLGAEYISTTDATFSDLVF